MAEFMEDIRRFQALVTERLERVPGAALRSLVRFFLDAEPVWSGDLVFHFVFTEGAPSSQLVSSGPRSDGPLARSSVISSAISEYMHAIPQRLPPGTYYLTNVMDYSAEIEQYGSPRGWGQGAVEMAAKAWPQHVRLAVQEVLREVPA